MISLYRLHTFIDYTIKSMFLEPLICNSSLDTMLKEHINLSSFCKGHSDIFIHWQYKMFACTIDTLQYIFNMWIGLSIWYKEIGMFRKFIRLYRYHQGIFVSKFLYKLRDYSNIFYNNFMYWYTLNKARRMVHIFLCSQMQKCLEDMHCNNNHYKRTQFDKLNIRIFLSMFNKVHNIYYIFQSHQHNIFQDSFLCIILKKVKILIYSLCNL